MNMEAFYFDGRSSKRHTVRLEATSGHLCLHGPEGERRFAFAEVRVSEPQGRAPRVLHFPDGGCCEVAQGAELDALLQALGYRASFVMRLQSNWPVSLGALVCVILILVAAYQWGLPLGAEIAAPYVPVKPMQQLSDAALRQLDEREVLAPSRLPLAQQEKLRGGFARLVALDPELASYAPNPQLIFRSAPDIGPNAFAMPGGQIVLFDELVDLTDDDEVLAVLAHELGHLNRRHSLRQLIQSSVTSAVLAAYFGDVSAAAAYLAGIVVEAKYSREMELEADAYGAAALRQQNKSPLLLASALEKLERSARDEDDEDEGDEEYEEYEEGDAASEEQNAGDEDESGVLGWISSHPDTRERIRRLKAL
ncbi:MAG: M48 family metallopeptidase [Zoogloeaceae bacterium]|jgi:Zn-dependent protease with chaperone function|nr:M48 family metallopeptidase [Zoogloeaceae bacterium]